MRANANDTEIFSTLFAAPQRLNPFESVSLLFGYLDQSRGTCIASNSRRRPHHRALQRPGLQELRARLVGAQIGTVDKFQGQQAPVVIYSMTTSSHADAPRGMEFLYSLSRLNVATSRAQCLCVLVASPTVFEADCRTPETKCDWPMHIVGTWNWLSSPRC